MSDDFYFDIKVQHTFQLSSTFLGIEYNTYYVKFSPLYQFIKIFYFKIHKHNTKYIVLIKSYNTS